VNEDRNGRLLKLNLGCGHRKFEGFVNVDSAPVCSPDECVDLESLPWPWADGSVDEIRLIHVLEHLGQTPDIYLGIMREMYRVCAPDAMIHIVVPHHRHDNFHSDPTHVSAVTGVGLSLFDREKCEAWVEAGAANTPLALYCKVDFVIEQAAHDIEPYWLERLKSGEISEADVEFAAHHNSNVIAQSRFVLRARKQALDER
jgi:hypothetical protein